MSRDTPYVRLKDAVVDESSVITVGFFDGVHLGHQAVLKRLVAEAASLDTRSVVVTFDRSPRAVVQETSIPILTSLVQKTHLLHSLGVSEVIVINFDRSFADLGARDFVESVLIERIGFQKIILGYDHRFGRGGTGTVETMAQIGSEHGFDVDIISAAESDGEAYSSSNIRSLLVDSGDVTTAAKRLGRYYSIAGVVVEGDRRGRKIGFPTANLEIDPALAIPKPGVYAVFATVGESGNWTPAVMNIGYRPTVTDGIKLVPEVHLIDADVDLYGRDLQVAFVSRLRDEHRFDSVESLAVQIQSDRTNCIRTLSAVSLPS